VHSDPTTTTLTTTSFDVAAGTVLLVSVFRDGSGHSTWPTITNNGEAVTWNQLARVYDASTPNWVNASVWVYWAYFATARTGLTVTGTVASANQMALSVDAFADVDSADPIGAVLAGATSGASSPFTTAPLTAEAASSTLYAAIGGGRATGSSYTGDPASSDLTEQAFNANNETFGLTGYKAMGAAGSTVTASASHPSGITTANWNWVLVEVKGTATEVTKTGSDPGTGVEFGSVSATVDGADAGTGTDTGHVAFEGSDAAVGSEDGYVAEGRDGGEAGAGVDSGDISATVTSGESATGADSGGTSATVTPAPDAGTGTELGHIAIPGGDTAVGTDALSPPLQATVTSGEVATGVEGGYVESLYGDLVISLYAIHPTTGALVALPHFLDLSISRQRNSRGSISLSYPVAGQNFDLLRAAITTSRDLEIEVWTSGTQVGALRGYLQEAAGDDTSETGIWEFAGSFLELRLDEARVFPQDRGALITDPKTGDQTYTNAKRELIFSADSPGEVGLTLLNQAHARSALSDIVAGFTTTHDSNGVPWSSVLSAKFAPGATYAQILNKLVDLGLVEWAVVWTGTQRMLKLWVNEGRGADLTVGPRPVVLRRGRNVLDAPRKWSVRESGTTVLAAGNEGVYRDVTDATALARRGRRIETYASLSAASDEEAVLAFAQAELAATTPGLHSISHDLGFLPGEPRPVIAFDVGDWVYSQTTTVLERLRVVQWTLTLNAQGRSGTVTLNDTVQDMLERLREQQNAITSGESVIGASEPGSGGTDTTPPAAPEGLAASSIAYQDPEHGPGQTLAMVTAGWLPVTTNADGSNDPRVEAAVLILDRMQDDPGDDPQWIHEDWTWAECPQIVRDYNDALLTLWDAAGNPPEQTWLAAYIAEQTQTPTAADDVAGYRLRYSYLGLEQVGGIPSSDPFPEEDRVYYEATPPGGTAATDFAFGGIEGGSRLRIEVCAFDRSGNQGPWASISHDTAQDATPPPKPSAPTGARIWFRTLDVPWDGLGAEGETMPIDTSHVRVWLSQGAAFPVPMTPGPLYPTAFDPALITPQYVRNLTSAGTTNIPDLPVGVGWYVALQAMDYTGNPSPRSDVLGPFTAEQLVSQDLLDDIIDANKLGPNSVENQHVVNGAITTAKIVDASIVTAKIGDLAVNTAKISDLSVGKLTAGTMTATVVLGGSFWTSLDPLVNRMGFSAGGMQMYRGAALVGEWKVSDGSMLVTGTYRSALSGERIHIETDGTLRFYPPSGTNYSRIANEGNDIVWRGPLDGNGYSGRVNVNMLGPGMNFSKEENLLRTITSEFVIFDRRMRQTAPFINLNVDGRRTNPVGGKRRVQFDTTNSSGDLMGTSFVNYATSSDSGSGGFFGQGAGIKFEVGQVLVTEDELNGWGVIKAAEFAVGSSEEIKEDIEDIRAILNPLRLVRSIRAKKFIKTQDKWYRPPATPENPDPEPIPVEDPPVSIGVIAEEMPEVIQQLGPNSRGGMELGVGVTSWLALLHGALNQLLDQESRTVTGRALVPNGAYMSGAAITIDVPWDESPLEVPSSVTAMALASMPAAMGKIRARLVPGSTTMTGCQVRLEFVGTGAVAVTSTLPIAVEAVGRYIWTPPYIPPGEQ
jgi:hypothetical protein